MSIKNYGFGSSVFFLHPIFVRCVSLLAPLYSNSYLVFEFDITSLSLSVGSYELVRGGKVFGYSNTMHHVLLLFE